MNNQAADVDGVVNIIDALMISQFAVKSISKLNCSQEENKQAEKITLEGLDTYTAKEEVQKYFGIHGNNDFTFKYSEEYINYKYKKGADLSKHTLYFHLFFILLVIPLENYPYIMNHNYKIKEYNE